MTGMIAAIRLIGGSFLSKIYGQDSENRFWNEILFVPVRTQVRVGTGRPRLQADLFGNQMWALHLDPNERCPAWLKICSAELKYVCFMRALKRRILMFSEVA